MQYHYVASEPSGRIREGDIDAANPAAVLEILAKDGLRPISIKVAGVMGLGGRRGLLSFFQRITVMDKVFMTKYLALMLKVGTDIFKAIDILVEDIEKPIIRSFLLEVRSNLEKGRPFYVTFANYPQFFSPVFISLIKAGENSGTLERSLEQLASDLEREYNLRRKVVSAFIYPALLFTASVSIVVLLLTVVVPRLGGVFASADIEPPAITRFLLNLSEFLRSYILAILIAFAGLVFALFSFKRSSLGRMVIARLYERLPIIKNLIKKLAITRFATTLASLMRGGIPILEALEITGEAVGNETFRRALLRISREEVAKGSSLGAAFRKEEIFPRAVSNLIAIGEKAGHTDEILQTLSGFYESEVDATLKTLVSLLEPALLLGIGILVGIIAVAVILPIYQLVSKF